MALTFASRPGADGAARAYRLRFGRKRDLAGLSPVLARSGALEARLAVTAKEVRRAQKLRYRVFFEEGGAIPDQAALITRRDVCRFDRVCDHLVVVDNDRRARDGSPKFVGVYRLLRQDVAEHNFGFYSAGEFDVGALIARRPTTRFLELGRACIASTHRGKRVLELLWRGVWAYARHHRVDALIGCASLPGVEAEAHATAIRLLSESGGNPAWRVSARPELVRSCDSVVSGAAPAADARSLLRGLPPLVKGYWRLGATFSPDPVVDRAFGTTDLFVVLPLSDIEGRYLDHFGVEAVEPPLAAYGAFEGRGIPFRAEFG